MGYSRIIVGAVLVFLSDRAVQQAANCEVTHTYEFDTRYVDKVSLSNGASTACRVDLHFEPEAGQETVACGEDGKMAVTCVVQRGKCVVLQTSADGDRLYVANPSDPFPQCPPHHESTNEETVACPGIAAVTQQCNIVAEQDGGKVCNVVFNLPGIDGAPAGQISEFHREGETANCPTGFGGGGSVSCDSHGEEAKIDCHV